MSNIANIPVVSTVTSSKTTLVAYVGGDGGCSEIRIVLPIRSATLGAASTWTVVASGRNNATISSTATIFSVSYDQRDTLLVSLAKNNPSATDGITKVTLSVAAVFTGLTDAAIKGQATMILSPSSVIG